MKKYIVGALFGFLLAFTVSAHAEVVNMFGKVVDGSFPLVINGQKAEKDVVTIEGTSYIPVRSAGALFGYDVSFIDSQVILKKKVGVDSVTNTTYDPVTIDKLNKWEATRQASFKEIADIEAQGKAELEAVALRKQKAQEEALREAERQKKMLDDINNDRIQSEAQKQLQEQQQKQTQGQGGK